MIYIVNDSTDPFFNHALEAYVLAELKEEAFILWRNRPSILIGRNQNALSEIHQDFVREKGIDVVRRLSGGGTVFCDLGNINFTFITRKDGLSNKGENSFERFAGPVVSALRALGVAAQFSGRNDILVNGMKVSGNAQYHEGEWLLHHGTLLFDGNLKELAGALKSKPLKFADKSVKSVAARVTNISEHLPQPMTVLAFRDYLKETIITQHGIEKVYQLTEKDFTGIHKIQQEKFESYEWNYGKSPRYAFHNACRFAAGIFELEAQIKSGLLQQLTVYGDYFGEKPMSDLCDRLVGAQFTEAGLMARLASVDLNVYAMNLKKEEFVSAVLGLETDFQEAPKRSVKAGPKPEWLRVKLQGGQETKKVKVLLSELSLNTVCQEANCPNQMECYNKGTATFMILGRNCTRNCTFCNVTRHAPDPVDSSEPEKVAQAVERLGLKYAVITSVTRDDLPDQGAAQFAAVVKAIRARCPQVKVELLIPDMQGREDLLDIILASEPDVLNHNVETVPALYDRVRPMANFERSLSVLAYVKKSKPQLKTKSGIMLGLGETEEQVLDALKALRSANCDMLTLGQYLQPSPQHIAVVEYVTPEQFEKLRIQAEAMGFKSVASAPLIRSSYHADQMNFE